MKHLFTFFSILSTCCLIAQTYNPDKFWGTYFLSGNKEKLLNLCEDKQWYYSNCISANIESTDLLEHNCTHNDLFGEFEITGENIELRNYKDELLFSFQIVDTMNLKVVYAKNFLLAGSFLNRHSSFFRGHRCRSVFYSDEFARWSVNELNDDKSNKSYEVLRFSKPGYVFKNESYKVEQLPDSIFKEN